MPLHIPVYSANRMLGHILNAESPENLKIKLYVNDVAPEPYNTAENYIEAHGYRPHILRGRDWIIEKAIATAAAHVFQFKGFKGAVYGYFLTLAESGDLLWSEAFSDGPYVIQNDGDKITVGARIKLEVMDA